MPKLSKRKRQLREIHIKRKLASATGDEGAFEEESTTNSASSLSDCFDLPSQLANGSNGRRQQMSVNNAESVDDSDDETPTISQLIARKARLMVDQRLQLGAAAASALSDVWAQCNKCNKWRRLPADTNVKKLPRKWYCSMNEFDPRRQSCSAPEEDYTAAPAPVLAVDTTVGRGKGDEIEDHITAQVTKSDMRKFCGLWSRRLKSAGLAESRLPPNRRPTGMEELEWVRCCNPECGKWRAVSRSMYPEPVFGKRKMWYCAMNAMDETVASCAAPQEPLWNCDWNLRKLRPSERNGVFNDYNDDDDGDDDDGENRCTADDVRATLAMLRRELAGAR